MKTILAISACILTFAVFAGTRQLGEIRANDYVVTNEDDLAAIAYTTAVSNKLEIGKQKKLVSGTNIKTVNGQSLLGSGNIAVGSITDVRTNGVSAVSGGIANITITQGGGGGGGTPDRGVWDSNLGVWWTPVMNSGKLTYQCTTNVNLGAEN